MTTAVEKKSQQDQNKSLIRTFIDEIFNKHNLSSIEKFIGKGSIKGIPYASNSNDNEGFEQFVADFFKAFPDWHTTIEHIVAENDLVMVFLKGSGTHKRKFQGFSSTHKSVKIRSAHLYKLKDEKIIGHWGVVDQLNFLKQTGVLLSERANEEFIDAKMVWIRDYSLK
jgi:predicted ester cyclase